MVWKVVFLLLPSVFSENEIPRGRGGQAAVLYHCGSFFLVWHLSKSLAVLLLSVSWSLT